MAGANWRPDLFYGLAMNADPNDPLAYPVWSDWTTGLMKVSNYERGRTFELDQGESSAPTVITRDVNEYLNPDNPSSPYVGQVEPYRGVLLLAQWPRQADITGGAVNLFNTTAWRGNKEDVRDGSFESFAVGAVPTWAAAVGAFTPAVSTSFPFQGTKSIRSGIAGGANPIGMTWPIACIPGRQYTASAYVLQDVANTQRLDLTDQVIAYESFNVAAASSWGTATSGGAWTLQGGAAANFNKGATTLSGDRVGTALCAAINVRRMQTLATTFTDGTAWTEFSFDAAPAVTNHQAGVVARFVDANNFYQAQAFFSADGSVRVGIQKVVAGLITDIAGPTVIAGLVWNLGERYRIALTATGTALAAYVWRSAVSPALPATAGASGTDATFTTGKTGVNAMNTDSAITPTFSFYAHGVLGVVNGTTTTATGAYQRLTCTFTATAPYHTMRVATAGTSAAATVNIDALQYEQGAAASAYITTGPDIFPVVRANLERYQRSYASGGFEGYVISPCVDAMAALQAISLSSEYAGAVMSLSPDYFWRLNDGTDTGLFADSSGNGQAALTRYVSKYGPGTDIEPGSAISIVGDAGATGVAITALSSGTSATRSGTALQFPGVMPQVLPTPGWSLTFSCWIQLIANPSGDAQHLFLIDSGTGSVVPLSVLLDSTAIYALYAFGSSTIQSIPTTAIIGSGTAHHVVATVTQDPTNTTVAIWLDGVKVTGTVLTSTVGYLPKSQPFVMLGVDVGGRVGGFANGIMSEVAVWNRLLTDTEITSLYTAGKLGFAGETTGARNARHIALGGYRGPTRITTTGGMTTMQPPSWGGQKDGLTDVLETTTAEQGTFWAAPDGYMVMESRQDRWLRLTPSIIIGEDSAGGEIPYLMDSFKADLDPLYVFANVTVGRNNGAVATGGKLADIARAARRYFPRAAGGDYDFATDAQAQDMANWIFNSHRAAMTRMETIEIDPVGYPTLWPIMLGLEIGRRVRVIRRAKAANAGAGITVTKDFFVEKIAIGEIDMEACTWKYKIQLSPINAGASATGAPTMQPWILEDTTYGVLDSTTVLGW